MRDLFLRVKEFFSPAPADESPLNISAGDAVLRAPEIAEYDPVRFQEQARESIVRIYRGGLPQPASAEALLGEAERLAQEAFEMRITYEPDAPIPAMLIKVEGRMSLYIDGSLSPAQKAFLILHEIGHAFLQHQAVLVRLLEPGGGSAADRRLMRRQEEQANTFAATWMKLQGYALSEAEKTGLKLLPE